MYFHAAIMIRQCISLNIQAESWRIYKKYDLYCILYFPVSLTIIITLNYYNILSCIFWYFKKSMHLPVLLYLQLLL